MDDKYNQLLSKICSLESTIANLSQQMYDLEQKYSDKITNDQVKEYIERYFDSTSISIYEKIS